MDQTNIGFILLCAITTFLLLFILVIGVVLHQQEKKRDERLYKHWQEVSKRRVLQNYKDNPERVRKVLGRRMGND